MTDVLIFAGVAVLMGLAIGLMIRFEAKRSRALEEEGSKLGLSYAEEDGSLPTAEMCSLNLFSLGRAQQARNVLRGKTMRGELLLFDYSYSTGSGKNKRTHSQTVCVFTLSRELPSFELRPEHLFHKIGQALGYQDLDFTSSPEFSAKYLLRAQNESAVRQLFGPQLLRYFESNPGWSVESNGSHLLIYRKSNSVSAATLRDFYTSATKLRELFG